MSVYRWCLFVDIPPSSEMKTEIAILASQHSNSKGFFFSESDNLTQFSAIQPKNTLLFPKCVLF